MNRIGMSSSCYYPLEIEKSFRNLAETGLRAGEVFINARSEFEPRFIRELLSVRDEYGIDIVSVHPYTSFAENAMLFSSYKRRFYDFLNELEFHFEAAKMLGAKYYIIHGIKIPGSISDEEYFERFAKVIELGKSKGILPIQENVVRHRSQSPDFLVSMKNYIGDGFKIVLDTKQAHRSGFTPFDFTEKLAREIVHVHISDFNEQSDCVTPLSGGLDFSRLFKVMNDSAYDGDYIIELYSDGYSSTGEIIRAAKKLEILFCDV